MISMDRQMQLILASFEYQNVWTKEDLEQAHVPGVVFRTKTDMELALNRLITYGHLEVDSWGNYRKPQ
jgi:hypothetical protein